MSTLPYNVARGNPLPHISTEYTEAHTKNPLPQKKLPLVTLTAQDSTNDVPRAVSYNPKYNG